LFCLFIISKVVFAQTYTEQGSPVITHYTPNDYGGSPQIWCAIQDRRGMVYFADNHAIIEFNGRDWTRISNSNNSIVRSMAVDTLGRIYVGASNEFGYLKPNARGELEYVSLAQPILEKGLKFYDIWKTLSTPKGIFFFANNYVFTFHEGVVSILPIDFAVQDAYLINNQIFLPTKKGLCRLKDSTLIQVTNIDYFSVIDCGGYNSIALNNRGHLCRINLLTGESHDFNTPAQNYFESHRINFLTRIDDTRFAITTVTGEILIMSITGEIIQIINNERGLLKGQIYSLFVDDAKNLWVCMSKGIVKVDINFPVLKFDEKQDVSGNIQSSINFNGVRYIGSLDGIYYLPKFDIDKMIGNHRFVKIKNCNDECWDFKVMDNRLYAICSSGLWSINDTVATNILTFQTKQAAHCFSSNPQFPGVFFIGMRGKLIAIKLNPGLNTNQISVVEEFDFPEIKAKIRRITTDKNGNLWLNTQFDGIYFIRFINGNIRDYRVTLLGKENGLPNLDGTKTYIVDNEIAITTDLGIVKPEFPRNNAAPDSLIRFRYSTIFGDKIKDATSHITQVSKNKYLIIGNAFYYATVSGAEVTFDTSGFSRLNNMHGVSKAFVNVDSTISFCATDAYLYYNAKITRDFNKSFNTLISKVEIDNDSTIFGGCFYTWNDSVKIASLAQTPEFVPAIDYKYNSITIHFSGLFYEDPVATQFQHQLVGFDKNWSNWSTENKAVYTNLREGKYALQVRSKSIYDTISNVAEYHFTIKAPWYRAWWAVLIYILLFAFVVYQAMILYARRLKLQKEYLELIVEERTGEIIEQARELKTINQKLIEMDKFKKGVTGMIVHDLKNPINAIINASDKQPEEQIKRIKQTGRQMLNLVLNILDVDKYEEAEIVLNLETQRLYDIVSKAYGQVLFLSNEKNINISNRIDYELAVRADAEMVERVFVNILTNAIKFTPNNGKIIVDAEIYEQNGVEQFVKVAITDNGMGIAADKINLVFQKFGQVTAKDSGSVRSTGLGLTYCKMVVEAHGGNIGVVSELENGSTFWFTLPQSKGVSAIDQSSARAEEQNNNAVELSETSRKLIGEYLIELQKTEFYKITEILSILEKLEGISNDEIRTWKQALIKAIDSGNELLYKKLL
jgi:signal transduction histidine kinase/ligand-binding sensor domain-containing protein